MCVSRSAVSDSLQPHGLLPARLLCPQNAPGKDTGVGCHFLLQGNLPDPEIDPWSPRYRQILYKLSNWGFSYGSEGKESPCNAGNIESWVQSPGQKDFLKEENGNAFRYSCLKNPWTEEPGRL